VAVLVAELPRYRPCRRYRRCTVEVWGTVIRITGKGLIIKLKPKSEAGWRGDRAADLGGAMLKRRQAEQEPNEWQAVFTSPLGHLRDRSNTQADL
jgi:hypothetical protein